ncbi:SDR family NAD(P)-dependent oxidoreductase [Clostridium estertheticum]|uniref:type I polyketide synthase n=1 Tax=Clostridium estertheticum TaxID=238834 RepID=UPI001C0A940A|nr:SDR family NAD(P)-dependent oxidoreductase [Clostridium estertheticum]MBU3198525.1 SDR family NAD(P)-dependent oxidoreductase [Clostridium estertheticum]WAG64506.1 SDR family NAD(P)-dependent oxidoreductase [Clostridium estertheticum]
MFKLNEIKLDNLINGNIKNNINQISNKDIAIIGVSLKMPNADTVEELWEVLRNGVDCIDEISYERRRDIESYLSSIGDEDKFNCFEKAAYLKDIDKFDYNFFNISPKEASLMDPNQRLFLETAWNAIEDAGYGGEKLVGSRTGIFVGFGSDRDYKKMITDVDKESIALSVPGNIRPFIASRLSYLMNFRGPSMMIDTTCSSSLVATHVACQSIRNGECELAIAGGIQLHLLPFMDANIGVVSSDNRTKTFDYESDGTGTGEGVIAILLKPLGKAIIDKDNIYAVIKGSSINHDGSSIGLTAPNAIAQADVIVRAWKNAGIDPETISYIEAHGTGTKLGDPIEIEGIQRAFKRYTNKKNFCAIGSIKSNIGHLDAASGLAGLLKGVLSLKYKKIPPTLHFNRPNKHINFIESPVYVNNKLTDWNCEGDIRRCAVSSFGLTGTNCNIVLEESPEEIENSSQGNNKFNILVLSAKSKESLFRLIDNYKKYVLTIDENDIRDICYTASNGRGHYNYRIAIIVNDKKDLINKLENINEFELDLPKDSFYGFHKVISEDYKMNDFEYTTNEIKEFSESAQKKIKMIYANEEVEKDILKDIAMLYIKGADIQWEIIYTNENNKKKRIPVYNFDKKRCWIDNLNCDSKYEEIYMTSKWNIENKEPIFNSIIGKTILIIEDNEGKGKEIAHSLRKKGIEVIEVTIEDKFKKKNESSYSITTEEKDYKKLIENIKNKNFTQIVHLQSLNTSSKVNNLSELDKNLQQGLYSAFNLIKGLVNVNIKRNLELILISDYANEVTKVEKIIKPENATLFALGMIAEQEYPNIKCKCIDIDDFTTTDELINELFIEVDSLRVSYRDGKRYVYTLEYTDINVLDDRKINIKGNGVYIITGGTGGLGIEMAKHLVSKNKKINIALINRSELPKHNMWKYIIRDNKDSKLTYKLSEILNMEKKGANIECISVDVSNEKNLTIVIENLRSKYENINGIIHCAGIAGNGYIIFKERETMRSVLEPKVYGAWLLNNLTKNDNLDFFILFSSVSSLIGGVGQSDYAAANAYLDSFQAYMRKQGVETITINWAGWRDIGMAKDYGVNVDTLFKIIDTKKGIYYFQKIFSKKISRVLIGEINYNYKLLKNGKVYIPCFSENIKKEIEDNINKDRYLINKKDKKILENTKAIKHIKEVRLKGDNNYTEIEIVIAGIWNSVLGFEEFNINDNFFEIGGNSIMITNVYEQLDAIYKGELSLTDFFAYPTIKKLAEYISSFSKNDDIGTQKFNVKSDSFKENVLNIFELIENGEMNIEKAMDYLKNAEDDYE